MTGIAGVLEWVRLGVFGLTAAAGVWLWWRQRSRHAALLASAFAVLVAVLVVAQLLPEQPAPGGLAAVARDLDVVGLALFPWLLAAFAWSFDRRFPMWLAGAAGGITVLAVWVLVLPPFPAAGARSPAQQAFVVAFVAGWSALTATAAVKLWRAGGAQPLVRARMRMMAVGAGVLAAALLVLGGAGQDDTVREVVINLLAIASAVMFAVAFVPPRMVRMWWRRRATHRWQDMQQRLIASVAPTEVAGAVTPVLSEVLGAGVAVISSDGLVLAAHGLTGPALHRLVGQVGHDEHRSPHDHWVEVNRAWLVVTETPYTPLFGPDEHDLLSGHALQLRLALERSELAQRNEDARRHLEAQHQETQTMLAGFAHDLRGPLAAISGLVGILHDEPDPTRRDQLVDRVEANIGHLSGLADAVVELARAGHTHGTRDRVDLVDVVAGVATRLGGLYPQLNVHVDDLPPVTASRLAMDQVFDNLLSNAARHAGRDEATVHVRRGPGRPASVVVDVIDNGKGIPAAEHDAVFAPFRRGADTTVAGTGVGLGLVRRIVHSHGGTITLLDGDTGAHFRLELPPAPAADQPTSADPPVLSGQAPDQPSSW